MVSSFPTRPNCARRLARSAVFALVVAVVGAATPAPGTAQFRGSVPSAAPAAYVGGPGSANYRLAARFAPYKLDNMLHDVSVSPRWIEGTSSFWYEWEDTEGSHYYIVDAARGVKRAIFDRDRIAAELTRITRDPYDARHLPIRSIRFIDANTLEFEVESSRDEEVEEEEVEGDTIEDQQEERGRERRRTEKKVHHFEYDVDTQTLRELEDYEEPDDHPGWASVSPDGNTVVFVRNHNLYTMSGADYQRILDARRGKSGDDADEAEEDVDVEEVQLTTDGEMWYDYSNYSGRGSTVQEWEKEEKDDRMRAPISWSKDSRRFAMVRADYRNVDELWVIHSVGNDRPELERYKYDMPGEENVTQSEIWIFDLQTREGVKVQGPNPFKDQDLDITTDRQFRYPDSEEPFRSLWLADNSDQLYYVRVSRDRHHADFMVADAATGNAQIVFRDSLNTYMETREPELLPNGDFLWWSERDGWAHLYRYGADGRLKNRLTEGPFSVRGIEQIDFGNGVVYFEAAGREDGEDPYYRHLYRVNLDGSGLRLLNPGDFDHSASVGPDGRYFVDNFSRVNTIPQSVVRNARGDAVLELETADFSQMAGSGWQLPEPFVVKADDGVTDIYGVMYLPFDFDPNKTYPIIAYVYPGPQTESVSKSFSTNRYETALAQFGFVVITVGNRGGHPSRSKWYHNYGYGNLRDYGLADKKAAIEQLADRHDFIDIDRVGIYGHSGGGFMSTAAMLVYPDFFDVAVSSSGNHTNDVYNRWWSETHHGVKEVVDDSGRVTFEYDIDKNPDLARNLKGHLMLTTGDIDNNVHHANTLRMAEALIKANKRFDYFVFPGQRHGYGNMSDYWFWLRAEYFVKHLLDDDTHWSADLVELQREQARRR